MTSVVLQAVLTASDDASAPIDLCRVEQWMQADDIEALGALHHFLDTKAFVSRISPPLGQDRYLPFALAYYERCLRENPDGEWADTRYEAGWGLVRLFVHLWQDEAVPRKSLLGIKMWLARLYEEGDEELRLCIVNATLEHLFENRKIAKFFKGWRDHKILGKAYADGMLWPAKGGKSPFTA